MPHLGGLMPLILGRLDYHAPLFLTDVTEPPSATARRLWYDTVAHGSVAVLRCAHAELGAERLLLGSDFPNQADDAYTRAVHFIRDAALPPADVEAILDGNATRLLDL